MLEEYYFHYAYLVLDRNGTKIPPTETTKRTLNTTRKSANSLGQGYLCQLRCKYIISVGDKLADVNAINFIIREAVHIKLMAVTTTLVAPMNISYNCDCTTDENRSYWIRTVSQHYLITGPCLPALPRYLSGLVCTPFLSALRHRPCPSHLPCTGPCCPPQLICKCFARYLL
jgi:hypothetical protein